MIYFSLSPYARINLNRVAKYILKINACTYSLSFNRTLLITTIVEILEKSKIVSHNDCNFHVDDKLNKKLIGRKNESGLIIISSFYSINMKFF